MTDEQARSVVAALDEYAGRWGTPDSDLAAIRVPLATRQFRDGAELVTERQFLLGDGRAESVREWVKSGKRQVVSYGHDDWKVVDGLLQRRPTE